MVLVIRVKGRDLQALRLWPEPHGKDDWGALVKGNKVLDGGKRIHICKRIHAAVLHGLDDLGVGEGAELAWVVSPDDAEDVVAVCGGLAHKERAIAAHVQALVCL